MPDLTFIYQGLAAILPMESMQLGFMQHALLGLLLLAPMTALMGIQVIHFRMAFFADAISHSAFTGVAIGLMLGFDPQITMPVFGVLVGLFMILGQRKTFLSSDTIIGVFFSGVVAFGLAVVSRHKNLARDIQQFLYGDILTISEIQILAMFLLLLILVLFQVYGFNRLLYIGMNPILAKAHQVRTKTYQYLYAALLSLVVIFSVQAVGVLLVTAMLIVPAAAARNLSKTAGQMVWWAIFINITSCVAGLVISAQDWAETATGATIILVSFGWFLVSMATQFLSRENYEQP